MKPRDIGSRVLAKPLRSPYGGAPRARLPRWLWLVAVAWLLWASVVSDHSLLRIASLKREIATAKTETRTLEDQTTQLDEQLRDPEARRFHAEEIARTKQGWAAPGEIVYRFHNGRPDTTGR